MIIAVESPVAKGYWEKNLASQLIQEAYAYADMEIQPKFEVAGKEGPERLVTPKPRIKTNQEILEDRRDEFAQDLQLNSKYTFDTFVQGEGNKLAAGAALAVADNPGSFYNPLFIFGGVGLGKTHLMQAIGHQMLAEKPHAKVVYIQSETFVNDFINSIKTKLKLNFAINIEIVISY